MDRTPVKHELSLLRLLAKTSRPLEVYCRNIVPKNICWSLFSMKLLKKRLRYRSITVWRMCFTFSYVTLTFGQWVHTSLYLFFLFLFWHTLLFYHLFFCLLQLFRLYLCITFWSNCGRTNASKNWTAKFKHPQCKLWASSLT